MAFKSITPIICSLIAAAVVVAGAGPTDAQEKLPDDRTLTSYHPAPRYRESESHPLRILAYVFNPIGWAFKEVVFRPLSYFASSTEETRIIMGFRDPYDYRQPSCFFNTDRIPDCHKIAPLRNAALPALAEQGEEGKVVGLKAVYFSDVNFDFNNRQLNHLGKARARKVAETLKQHGAVKVVLQGHADSRGSAEYNQKLGLDRADAVRKELVALGVNNERLSTVSFGESKPLFTENAEWAYAANRRVEVSFEQGESASEERTITPEPLK
jgi:hypothetical protein